MLLTYDDLSNNKFEGPLPLPTPSTLFFSVANNEIIEDIPSTICNYTTFKVFDLSNNNLTGDVPRRLANFTLDLLNLRKSSLQGTILQSFSFKSNLRAIDMSHNQIEGKLPRTLVNCNNLENCPE